MPLSSANFILECLKKKAKDPEGFRLFTVYGELRIGKSAYAFKTCVEVLQNLGYDEKNAWELLKGFIIFHPQHFFDKLDEMKSLGLERIPFLVWDDAGLWLFAMKWRDPFIIAFLQEMNVIGTKIASIIFTTPSPTYILKKLRQFPSAINVHIIDCSHDPTNRWLREARGYKHWYLPSGMSRVRLEYVDRYSALLPNDFFRWYKPFRDAFETMARNLLREKWIELQKSSKVLETLEQVKEFQLPSMSDLGIV
jgi:hypothetical protein